MSNRIDQALFSLHTLWTQMPREQKRLVWNADLRNRRILEALEICGPESPRRVADVARFRSVPGLYKSVLTLLEEFK